MIEVSCAEAVSPAPSEGRSTNKNHGKSLDADQGYCRGRSNWQSHLFSRSVIRCISAVPRLSKWLEVNVIWFPLNERYPMGEFFRKNRIAVIFGTLFLLMIIGGIISSM